MIEKFAEYVYGDNNSEVIKFLDPSNEIDGLEKTASYDEDLQRYINSLERENGYLYAIVNALSAGEYYGPNRNGDYFPEEALKAHHKTFEEYGHVYKFHKNKDPKKAMGKVIFSNYNDKMKRVELVVKLKEDHPDVINIIKELIQGRLPKTSMGCFKPGTPVTLSNGTSKNIEDIQEGDKVRTHKGNIRKVTKLTPRKYDDFFVKAHTKGKYVDNLETTSDHPVFVITEDKFFTKDKKNRKIRNKDLTLKDGEWLRAKDLKKGDCLVIPKFKSEETSEISLRESRLLGYYLAEGHLTKESNGVILTAGINDDMLNSLPPLFPEYNFVERTRANTTEAVDLSVYNKELQTLCLNNCGKYAGQKELSENIFKLSDENKKHFLGAYIEGDGFISSINQMHISSCNKNLLKQVKLLAESIGLSGTLGKIEHKGETSGVTDKDTTEYILRFRKGVTKELNGYCSKAKGLHKEAMLSGGKGGPYMYKDFIGYTIDKVTYYPYNGKVYNFEVEEDNSYLVNDGIAVHNCKVPFDECSVTHKRAKTRAEYSHYLKNMMGAILKDGRRVYAINRKPRFFDLSLVTIPADPISGFMASLGLEKVARKLHLPIGDSLEKTASFESPEQVKEWLTTDPKGLIKSTQENLSQEAIEKLAKYPLNETLSTFLGLRILPKKEDFQKLALYSIGKKDDADLLEQKGVVFDCSPDMEAEIPEDVSLNYCNEKIAEEIKEEISGLSLTKTNIINRILEKQAGFIPLEPRTLGLKPNSSQDRVVERSFINKLLFDETEEPKLNPVKDPLIPMFALGTLYAGYAKIFGSTSNADEFTKFVSKHPWLAPITAGAVAYGIKEQQERDFKDSPSMKAGHVPGTPYNEYTNPRPPMPRHEPIIKEAGVPQFLGTMAVATPASYYQSAKLEEKVQRGEPISGMENVVRKNPLATAFTGSVVGRSLYKQMRSSASSVMNKDSGGAIKKWFNNKGIDPKTRKTFGDKTASYMSNLNEETINLIYNELTS